MVALIAVQLDEDAKRRAAGSPANLCAPTTAMTS